MKHTRRGFFGSVMAVVAAPVVMKPASAEVSAEAFAEGFFRTGAVAVAGPSMAEWKTDWDRATAAVAANEQEWLSWCEFVFTDNTRRLSRAEARAVVCRAMDLRDQAGLK